MPRKRNVETDSGRGVHMSTKRSRPAVRRAPARTSPRRTAAAPGSVLDDVLARVVRVAQPDRVILFGSAARETAGPDSDIDLLVIKAGVPHRRRLAQEIYLNLFGIATPVDIVVVTPEDVDALRDTPGTIIESALREGRQIYAATGAS